MQDFTICRYEITLEQLEREKKTYNDTILVIINGEYYTLIDDPKTDKPLRQNLVYND